MSIDLSVIIPTYNRDKVLIETIEHVLALSPRPSEILIVDQTAKHDGETEEKLERFHLLGNIKWIRLEKASHTHALNHGIKASSGQVLLFLDDDIIPCSLLFKKHLEAYQDETVSGVVGQVLQPGERTISVCYRNRHAGLKSFLDFPFNSDRACFVENVITCNFSLRRDVALRLGGFDEQFTPPVGYREETEFARRIIQDGGKLWFEPDASLRHLRSSSGGTRSKGHHMKSASPVHGVGDYYYALCCGRGVDRISYMLKRPFREICTKFHLTHPWFIPVKLIGELRAVLLGIRLRCQGGRLLLPDVSDSPEEDE